jgi:hypothetical protein
MKCVICDNKIDKKMHEGEQFWFGGNNAQPVADGRCCDLCDCMLVIPARMGNPSNKDGVLFGMLLYRQRMDNYKTANITNKEEEE